MNLDLFSFSDSLTQTQLLQLQIATHVSSAIGILGALTTLTTYAVSSRYRGSAMARLAAGMAIGDLVGVGAKALGPLGFSQGSQSTLCQAQAVLQQWGDLSSILWTATIALNLLLILWKRKTRAEMGRYERAFQLLSFLLPLPLALAPLWLGRALGVSGSTATSLYGDAELWCWFSHESGYARYIFFYGELWLVFLLNLLTYLFVGRVVWKQTRTSPQALSPHAGPVDGGRKVSGSGPHPPTLPSQFSVGSVRPLRPSKPLKAAKVRYARNTSLYLLAFLMTWLPGTLYRALRHLLTPTSAFAFLFAMAILSPIRGMTNCLVYLYLSRTTRERSDSNSSSPTCSFHSGASLDPPDLGDLSAFGNGKCLTPEPTRGKVHFSRIFANKAQHRETASHMAPNGPGAPKSTSPASVMHRQILPLPVAHQAIHRPSMLEQPVPSTCPPPPPPRYQPYTSPTAALMHRPQGCASPPPPPPAARHQAYRPVQGAHFTPGQDAPLPLSSNPRPHYPGPAGMDKGVSTTPYPPPPRPESTWNLGLYGGEY
ncbi:MAG: hypothetical protein DHS80DRAFT_32680 [Piptocephalis tieghemiana]|nr:MAG: hypothetical protein DHS80DRAFT_32680 [Piptocephalis tieghemiana]